MIYIQISIIIFNGKTAAYIGYWDWISWRD